MIEQRSKVDDVFIQLTLSDYSDRFDWATQAFTAFAMHLRGLDGLTIGLDDAAGKLGSIGIRPVPVGNEYGVFDDGDGWWVAADAEPQYLAQFITPELTKTVKRKLAWFKGPRARDSVYGTAV